MAELLLALVGIRCCLHLVKGTLFWLCLSKIHGDICLKICYLASAKDLCVKCSVCNLLPIFFSFQKSIHFLALSQGVKEPEVYPEVHEARTESSM